MPSRRSSQSTLVHRRPSSRCAPLDASPHPRVRCAVRGRPVSIRGSPALTPEGERGPPPSGTMHISFSLSLSFSLYFSLFSLSLSPSLPPPFCPSLWASSPAQINRFATAPLGGVLWRCSPPPCAEGVLRVRHVLTQSWFERQRETRVAFFLFTGGRVYLDWTGEGNFHSSLLSHARTASEPGLDCIRTTSRRHHISYRIFSPPLVEGSEEGRADWRSSAGVVPKHDTERTYTFHISFRLSARSPPAS